MTEDLDPREETIAQVATWLALLAPDYGPKHGRVGIELVHGIARRIRALTPEDLPEPVDPPPPITGSGGIELDMGP